MNGLRNLVFPRPRLLCGPFRRVQASDGLVHKLGFYKRLEDERSEAWMYCDVRLYDVNDGCKELDHPGLTYTEDQVTCLGCLANQ